MKIGIITGASSGMGKEFVKLTMNEKMDLDEIWVIARRKERLEAWPRLYKDQRFRILPLDLLKAEDMERLRGELADQDPQIELFIHCAGFGILGRIDEIPPQEQMEMVDLNCRCVVELTTMVLPYMRNKGRMIYLASAAAFMPQPGFAAYAAAKAFVLSYVRSLRAEVFRRGIGITLVCPGAVKTEFFNRAAGKKHLPAYKKMVMADPKKVVKKAWKDSIKGKEISIYGRLMHLFYGAAKIVPHSLILYFMREDKEQEKYQNPEES